MHGLHKDRCINRRVLDEELGSILRELDVFINGDCNCANL